MGARCTRIAEYLQKNPELNGIGLRILIISNAIGYWRGGHSRNIVLLAKAIKTLGHSVDFFVYSVQDESILEEAFKVNRCTLKRFSVTAFSQQARDFVLKNTEKYDIVHSNGKWGYLLAEQPRNKRPPVFIHLRSANYRNAQAILHDEFFWKKPRFMKDAVSAYYEWMLDRRAIKACDHVLCNSTETLQAVARRFPDKDKFSVLLNGVELPPKTENDVRVNGEPNDDHPRAKRHTIGYFGQFNLQKGWKRFFDISREIISRNKEIDFLIAGWGPLQKVIDKFVRSDEVKGRIRNFGRIDSEDAKRTFFGDINLFLCPTAPGTTSLEALVSGIPVLVAKRTKDLTDGMDIEPFVQQGISALLIDKSPGEVADKLLMMLDDFSESDPSKAIRDEVRNHYSWGGIADTALQKYREVLG